MSVMQSSGTTVNVQPGMDAVWAAPAAGNAAEAMRLMRQRYEEIERPTFEQITLPRFNEIEKPESAERIGASGTQRRNTQAGTMLQAMRQMGMMNPGIFEDISRIATGEDTSAVGSMPGQDPKRNEDWWVKRILAARPDIADAAMKQGVNAVDFLRLHVENNMPGVSLQEYALRNGYASDSPLNKSNPPVAPTPYQQPNPPNPAIGTPPGQPVPGQPGGPITPMPPSPGASGAVTPGGQQVANLFKAFDWDAAKKAQYENDPLLNTFAAQRLLGGR